MDVVRSMESVEGACRAVMSMDMKVLKKDKDKVVFQLDGINPAVANMIRRFAMNHVPALAIEDVKIQKNSSALYDEMFAHRLGLIPLVTDLKSYTMKSECSCKDKGCAKCGLVLSLKAKGPGVVYAGEIKSNDPKVKPAEGKLPIVKLLQDQEVQVEMKAVLGRGKDHIKFSPGLVYYRGVPALKTASESNITACVEECNGLVAKKGGKLEVADPLKWNEAAEYICERHNVDVVNSREDFLFVVEPWGQLSAKEMVMKAVEVFDKKIGELAGLVKKTK